MKPCIHISFARPARSNLIHVPCTHTVDPCRSFNINGSVRISTRHIHGSTRLCRSRRRTQFTPSSFQHSNTINVSGKFAIRRELEYGANAYGIRRYLLVPRPNEEYDDEKQQSLSNQIIASLNANRNIIFGARLHINLSSSSSEIATSKYGSDEHICEYLAACGSLLDVSKEDASVNGQQVQALATLGGLCSWVRECLEREDEGSDVVTGLMHGDQQPNILGHALQKETALPRGKWANQRIRNINAGLVLKKKKDRMQTLEAIRAIATGTPRQGHTIVGAGTYRNGQRGWVALAWEYSQQVTTDFVSLKGSFLVRERLEEVALYKSRGGEVTKIEHLAHKAPEYLRDAGGAMARMFFV